MKVKDFQTEERSRLKKTKEIWWQKAMCASEHTPFAVKNIRKIGEIFMGSED